MKNSNMINLNTLFLDEMMGNKYPVDVKSWNLPEYERSLIKEIIRCKKDSDRFTICVEGLPKTGKTTLLKQLLVHCQNRGKNICYFSFSRKSMQNPRNLEVILDFFVNENNQSCICLDDVCYIKGWQDVIHKYFQNTQSSFFLSGTISEHENTDRTLHREGINKFVLNPAGFNDYLDARKLKDRKYYLEFPNPLCGNLFRDFLEGFLIKGSFPELYNIEDRMLINQYIKTSVLEKTIFEDIPVFFSIKELQKLFEVFNQIAYHSGDFIYESSFSDITNLSKPTIETFFAHLDEFHLIDRIYTISNIEKKVKRKKKVYLSSASLYYNNTANFSSNSLYLTAVNEKLSEFNPVIYRDNQSHEVDFIVHSDSNIYPFSVKAVDKVFHEELHNLIYFIKKNKLKEGYFIYKGLYNVMEFNDVKIFFIPLSTFLASEISFS
ncbi:MAG: ATP-binding protein [Ignavibacteriae bacterium]|nr:ATP-binding protein [Ignavibacteriota bacterium]